MSHSRANSSNQLDDIFARLEPDESDGLGRIDDEPADTAIRLSYQPKSELTKDSPRAAWNRVWR